MKINIFIFLVVAFTMNISMANPKPGNFLSLNLAKQVELQKDNFNHQQIIKNKNLEKQARELESVLISKMIEPMFPSGQNSMLYGGGQGSDIYRMLMVQEYGKIMARNGGIGIADGIIKDLSK